MAFEHVRFNVSTIQGNREKVKELVSAERPTGEPRLVAEERVSARSAKGASLGLREDSLGPNAEVSSRDLVTREFRTGD